MDLKQVVQWLLDNKYGLVVNNQFVLTQKLNQELFDRPITNEVAVTPIVEAIVIKPVPKVIAPNDRKTIWNEFIERCEIPWRVNTSSGAYTVRQYNEPAAKKLIAIIKDPLVEYDKLVESTKNYYKTVAYKILLSKYLLNDVWADEYKNYKSTTQRLDDGSSRWET